MSEPVDLREFLGPFVVEVEELIVIANASLLDIESTIDDGTPRPRATRELFRALHTIKGLASMIGVEPIVEIAHALETLVRPADRAGGSLRRGAIEIALQAVQAISERVRAVADKRPVTAAPAQLISAIASIEAMPATSITEPAIPPEWAARLSASERQQLGLALQHGPVWKLSFSPSEANAARGLTITTVRSGLGAIGEIIKVIPRSIPASDDRKAGVAFDLLLVSQATRSAIAAIAAIAPDDVLRVPPPETASPETAVPPPPPIEAVDDTSTLDRAVVRVELSRLDDLQDQLSLLIVSRFRLEREIAALVGTGHDMRRLTEVVRIQGRQLRDLRRAILRARMVRVAEMVEPLGLVVRGLARSRQQVVHLELDVNDVELDKAVADRLLPALMHLVRNAIDHGIETPEQRVAAGKPEAGAVRISCFEVAGSFIEIVVADDGRGVDRDEIAARAHQAIADDLSMLTVLATPGFSTRDVATTTSGRGLGMDIVRQIVTGELGGELSMTTHPGTGTTFRLRVPVTISVMDVLSFQCGSQAFVVPALAVEEIIEVRPDMIVVPPKSLGARTPMFLLARRDRAIRVVSLGALLAVDSGATATKALVVRRKGEEMAFTVDRVIGRQEVFIRSINDPLVDVPGIAGATDLGDGRLTLLLDLDELGIVPHERGVS